MRKSEFNDNGAREMKKFTVLAAVLGSAWFMTGCERTMAPGSAELPTVENVQRKTERLESVLVEVMESFATESSLGIGGAADADLPTEVTVALQRVRGVSLETGSWRSPRVIAAPGARTLPEADTPESWRSHAAKSVDDDYLRRLRLASNDLQKWTRPMGKLPAAERLAFQRAWSQSEPRLRAIAEQIVKSSPVSADLYGPALFELLEQVRALSERSDRGA